MAKERPARYVRIKPGVSSVPGQRSRSLDQRVYRYFDWLAEMQKPGKENTQIDPVGSVRAIGNPYLDFLGEQAVEGSKDPIEGIEKMLLLDAGLFLRTNMGPNE